MALLRLYPFRYRDPRTGAWVRARYKATPEDIRARYAEWMFDGEPETRGGVSVGFNPYPRAGPPRATGLAPAATNVELQPQRGMPPALDRVEAELVGCFLRRYITYCARRRRYAAMNGAAALLWEVRQPVQIAGDAGPKIAAGPA